MLAIKWLFEHRCRSSQIEQQRSTSTATAVERRDVSCVVLYSSSTQLYSCTAGELAHDAEALVFIRYYGYRDEGMLKYVALN